MSTEFLIGATIAVILFCGAFVLWWLVNDVFNVEIHNALHDARRAVRNFFGLHP